MYFIDFETRSEADLAKVGAEEYARHPSTEVLCLAYLWAEIDKPSLWVPLGDADEDYCPAGLETAIASGFEFHAFNAAFEIAIWKHVMVARHGWPEILPEQWHCTMARAAYAGLPQSLDKASRALKLPFEKDMEGNRLMLKHCKPRKETKKNKAKWHEDPAERERIYEYCKQDTIVEKAIHDATPEPPLAERTVWLLNQKINERGIGIDRNLCKAALSVYEQHTKRLDDELNELTAGEVERHGQRDRLLSWLADRGVALTDMTAATVKNVLETWEIPDDARRALEIRKELSLTSIRKYKSLLAWSESDGRAKGVHQYYGAERTGRWAGRGPQLQNIPRGNLAPDELEAAADRVLLAELLGNPLDNTGETLQSLIRSSIWAENGELRVIDFASIEARVLAWLADQRDLLALFRDGRDAYVELANKIYGKPSEEITKQERFVGKVATLGLGYGMGDEKFKATIDGFAAKFGFELDMPLEEAERIVRIYREANYKIRNFWWDVDNAALDIVKNGCDETTVGRLTLDRHGDWMRVQLPSGRRLHYYKPEWAMREVVIKGVPQGRKAPRVSYLTALRGSPELVRVESYGAKFVENITQAVSRDLLAESLVRLDRAGYDVVMHVHDEIVVEGADLGEKPDELMNRVPKWAKGVPIATEGFTARRYRK